MSLSSNDGKTLDSQITKLYLDKNMIGENGAKSLSKMFKANNRIIIIHLNENEINNRGLIAISHALEDNLSIESCHLYGNKITEEIQILVKKKHASRVSISNSLF